MNEYQRYLIEEFADEYQERRMSRRDLVRRAVLIMGSVPASMAALAAVGCGDDENEFPEGVGTPERTPVPSTPTTETTPIPAVSPSPASGDVRASDVRFTGPGSDLLGYLARPAGEAIFPGVLVIHENRGLNEHTKDVTRRFAAEGFIALAVDLVSRKGGSTGDTAANTGALGSANPSDLVADMVAYGEYLAELDGVKAGGIGVTGYCFGGGYAFETAIASELVKAAAPYYGICRLIDQLATTRAAVLAIYGERDARVTSQADRVREELAKTGAALRGEGVRGREPRVLQRHGLELQRRGGNGRVGEDAGLVPRVRLIDTRRGSPRQCGSCPIHDCSPPKRLMPAACSTCRSTASKWTAA